MDRRYVAAAQLSAVVATELTKGLDQIGLSSEVVILLKPEGVERETLVLSYCKLPGVEPLRAILESAYEQVLSRDPDIAQPVNRRGG